MPRFFICCCDDSKVTPRKLTHSPGVLNLLAPGKSVPATRVDPPKATRPIIPPLDLSSDRMKKLKKILLKASDEGLEAAREAKKVPLSDEGLKAAKEAKVSLKVPLLDLHKKDIRLPEQDADSGNHLHTLVLYYTDMDITSLVDWEIMKGKTELSVYRKVYKELQDTLQDVIVNEQDEESQVRLLDAFVNAQNSEGLTPLDLAIQKKSYFVALCLKDFGARCIKCLGQDVLLELEEQKVLEFLKELCKNSLVPAPIMEARRSSC